MLNWRVSYYRFMFSIRRSATNDTENYLHDLFLIGITMWYSRTLILLSLRKNWCMQTYNYLPLIAPRKKTKRDYNCFDLCWLRLKHFSIKVSTLSITLIQIGRLSLSPTINRWGEEEGVAQDAVVTDMSVWKVWNPRIQTRTMWLKQMK